MMTFNEEYFDEGLYRVGTRCEKWDACRAEHGEKRLAHAVLGRAHRVRPRRLEPPAAEVSADDAHRYSSDTSTDDPLGRSISISALSTGPKETPSALQNERTGSVTS